MPIKSHTSGRSRLMQAALRLASRSRSIHALGLRAIAREAGLNPNTFYRHFSCLDDLALAIIDDMVQGLRQPLRELRHQAARAVSVKPEQLPRIGRLPFDLTRGRHVTRETVRLFFDYVAEHPEPFVVGVRELNGPSPKVRQALRRIMEEFATDMAEDLHELNLLPSLDYEQRLAVSHTVIRHMFQVSIDIIEQPEQRPAIQRQAERMILTHLAGALMMSQLEENPVDTQ